MSIFNKQKGKKMTVKPKPVVMVWAITDKQGLPYVAADTKRLYVYQNRQAAFEALNKDNAKGKGAEQVTQMFLQSNG